MNVSREVSLSCIEADKQCKILAAEYKRGSRILKKRINEINKKIKGSERKSTTEQQLEAQLTILNQMLRTTCEIGREAERYYEKGWWRSEVYTLNTR